MANILTPLSLWGQFDASLETEAEIISASETDGVVMERVTFMGRNTDDGRVKIAAAFAYDSVSPSLETVIVFSDSVDTIDESVLKLFVSRGYSALMVDYRGKWKGCSFFTEYPECIGYANTCMCGRYKDYVDESADITSWYEWVAVGIYACKYVRERTGGTGIAVAGFRDGGEIAWKVGVAVNVSCIIPVCAAGWKAYSGVSKYLSEEPQMDSERYRFIAGIDSQAYAPYVKCPVLMLCSTNDARFDYDRAYDTFSRINPEYLEQSAISYSVRCNSGIGEKSVNDMFMFLDKYLKKRQVFIPKPAEVTVEVDKKANLVARVNFDDKGIMEACNVYLAEDNIVSSLREWVKCPFLEKVSSREHVFGLNIYEKTSTVFVLCHVTYSNGFTIWSKMTVKKISGKFRNMQTKCRVVYTNANGTDGFCIAAPQEHGIGGIFFPDSSSLPVLVTKAKNIKGIYCEGGLTTYRMNTPKYAPVAGSMLSLDVFCDENAEFVITVKELSVQENYVYTANITGGVWQKLILECKNLKSENGMPLAAFTPNMKLTVNCKKKFAINNVMWL